MSHSRVFWRNFLPQKLWLHNIFDKNKVCVFSSLGIRGLAVLGCSVTFIHVDVCTTAHLIIIIISLPVAAIKQDSIINTFSTYKMFSKWRQLVFRKNDKNLLELMPPDPTLSRIVKFLNWYFVDVYSRLLHSTGMKCNTRCNWSSCTGITWLAVTGSVTGPKTFCSLVSPPVVQYLHCGCCLEKRLKRWSMYLEPVVSVSHLPRCPSVQPGNVPQCRESRETHKLTGRTG